ncbi:MAG: hypothetical protein GDA52_10470 [Rhodobacteraceae bacterium]|nr:hypothetical protein [Paracoccaceae bacterium]
MTDDGTSLEDMLAALDPARRAAIEAEADRLHAEYLKQQALRKAKKRAKTPSVRQGQGSGSPLNHSA